MSDISRGNTSDMTSSTPPQPSTSTPQSSLVKYDPMGVTNSGMASYYTNTSIDTNRRPTQGEPFARHYQQLMEYQVRLRRQLALHTGYHLMSGLPDRSQQAIMARYPGMSTALARNNMAGLSPDMKTLLNYFYSQKSPYTGLPLNQTHMAMNYHCQPEEPKPSHSYIGIIAMAILNSKEKKLVLSDIYQWILDNYPYFRRRGPGWRNSIRHNLSLNDCFIKSGRSANGKGHYWAVHPANVEDFKRGDFRRRRAQRKVRKAMGLAVPDDDDSPSPSPTPTKRHDLFCNFQSKEWVDENMRNKSRFLDNDSRHDKEFSRGENMNDTSEFSNSPKDKDFNFMDHHQHHHRHQSKPHPTKKRLFDVESLLSPDPIDLRPSSSHSPNNHHHHPYNHHHNHHHHHHHQNQQQQKLFRNWFLDDQDFKSTSLSNHQPIIVDQNTHVISPGVFHRDEHDPLTPGDETKLKPKIENENSDMGSSNDVNIRGHDSKKGFQANGKNDKMEIGCDDDDDDDSNDSLQRQNLQKTELISDLFNQHHLQTEVSRYRHFSAAGEPIKSEFLPLHESKNGRIEGQK